jgi:tight adherence protein B
LTPGTQLLALAGGALAVAGATTAAVLVLRDPDSRVRRLWAEYVRLIERDVRFLMLRRPAPSIVRAQALVLGALIVGAVAIDWRLFYAAALCLVVPPLWLRRMVRRRRARLEQQLDGWLLMVANMLKSTGSLAEAVISSARLSTAPMAQEIDLVAKEVKLGSPLDVALRGMAARVGSSLVAATITGLLVGRHTGGDLPRMLERSAAALREITRLEGVVRSQTSQAKLQLVVMALSPPAIYYGLKFMDPHFFDPLTGLIGLVVYGAAVALWLGSIVLARKILSVDV